METKKDEKSDVKPEKKKRFMCLIRGFVTLLPIVLFVLFLVWTYSLIKDSVSWLGALIIAHIDYQIPVWVVNVLSFFVLLFLVWLVGFLMDEKILGDKLRGILHPIIKKIPILNYLVKVTNQVFQTLSKKNSLKETVLLRLGPLYLVGFITAEHPKKLEEDLKNPNLVSAFFATSPNPANGLTVAIDKDYLIHSTMDTAEGMTYIISMGTATESTDPENEEQIGKNPQSPLT